MLKWSLKWCFGILYSKTRGELVKTSGAGTGTFGGDHENEQKSKSIDPKELDENLRVAKEAEEKEKAARDVEETLKAQKNIFHLWTLERILNEDIDNPKIYWLEPLGSFKLQNSPDPQIDLPITPKAFQFCCFDRVVNAPPFDSGADKIPFSFYLKHVKPQYETWSSKKIIVVKVSGPIETESFFNVRFKVERGATSQIYEFTITDLPCLNLYDWILLLHLLVRDEKKFEPIIAHLKRMLVSYILDNGNMDVEIVAALQRKPTVLPKEAPKDFEE
ncbi:unnamed protein product [Lactuca saligna]|uniref:Uncharacterized protein n=1 Tax=Lactuca saligna TaxID=75948 RepID=A0AA35ZG05_LACSI|nr:unnamed protein product [Lactuca saligna]